MGINVEAIYKSTWDHYQKAKRTLIALNESRALEHFDAAISDVIPGFSADKLEFGSYDEENYAVLFVDMRRSTERARTVGAQKTFLTMHVFLPALLEVVQHYHGKVIDIMGDGLMVFWGGKVAHEKEKMTNDIAMQNAGLCGRDMLTVCEKVINPIVSNDRVVVTKIGISGSYDVKAFGDCINTASKYANSGENRVKVSKKVKDSWPSSKGGKIRFTSTEDGAYILHSI